MHQFDLPKEHFLFAVPIVPRDRRDSPKDFYIGISATQLNAEAGILYRIDPSSNSKKHTAVTLKDPSARSKVINVTVLTEQSILVVLDFYYLFLNESLEVISQFKVQDLSPDAYSCAYFDEAYEKAEFIATFATRNQMQAKSKGFYQGTRHNNAWVVKALYDDNTKRLNLANTLANSLAIAGE